MDATIPIPFALGQELWWVGNGYREEWITCPECAGTLAITMVLGNGEQASLACATCSQGYEPPRGHVPRVIYQHTPTRFIPHRVSVYGDHIRYSTSDPGATCYGTVDAEHLFLSLEQCQEVCEKLNAERTKRDEAQRAANLASKRRNMAFSVSYWRQRVAGIERELEVARKRLDVSKEKAKDKPEGGAG